MPWRGGRPSVAAMTPQECNSTQVPPPLFSFLCQKRACFCPIYHSICSKNAISANMFQKWPGKIKYKKKIQTFWRRLWLRGIQTPLPPWRGVGGRVFENLPYAVTRHLEHDVNKPLCCGKKSKKRIVEWWVGQGQVGMQGAAPVLPSTQARQPTATSTRSSLILQTVSQKRLFFSDMKKRFKCTVQKVHNM